MGGGETGSDQSDSTHHSFGANMHGLSINGRGWRISAMSLFISVWIGRWVMVTA